MSIYFPELLPPVLRSAFFHTIPYIFSLPDNLDQLIKNPLASLQAHVYIQLVSDSAQSVLHGLY